MPLVPLSKIYQNGKDLISAYWDLPPSLPVLLAARASPCSRAPPGAIQTPLMVVPSHLPQCILLSQHQYIALSKKFHAYKAKQRIQVTPSSLLGNITSFLGKNAFAVRAGETTQCFQRVRVPRVTGSIVPCSSALSLYGHQFCSKASEAGGDQDLDIAEGCESRGSCGSIPIKAKSMQLQREQHPEPFGKS